MGVIWVFLSKSSMVFPINKMVIVRLLQLMVIITIELTCELISELFVSYCLFVNLL